MTKEKNKVSRREAITILWNRGILKWKLDSTQKSLYENYQNSTKKTLTWNCSRRLGKSWALCVISTQVCIQKPNSVVKYVAPEQKMVRTIIKPIMRDILKDCPPELMPTYKTADNIYVFPNGSEIQLAGTDNGNHNKLRGGNSDLCIVDEAGFCSELNEVVHSVLLPTTLLTNGKIILSSTTPPNADHDFINFIKKAELEGNLVKKTVLDAVDDMKNDKNPRITKEIVNDIAKEYPNGMKSTEFQREYMCKIITDEYSAVIPEFTEELKKVIILEWPRPPFYDAYTAMDLGFKDLTVVLFAYYDFKFGKVIIEDELVLNGPLMTTDLLAEKIKEKEGKLWVNKLSGEMKSPYLRVSDNNLIVINDLQRLHGLLFLPTAKDDSEAAINNMRMELAAEKVIINPRCKVLIHHLKNATWNKSRRGFDRSPDAGHYDAVDALKYLLRNVQWTKNPYPSNYSLNNRPGVFVDPYHKPDKEGNSIWLNLFKIRKSLKN